MNNFKSKSVLITGATGGIGHALAEVFFASGANLILIDINADKLENLSTKYGINCEVVAGDVADESTMERAVNIGVEKFGRIDIAVLNAGIEGVVAEIGQFDTLCFDEVMRINVRGVFVGLSKIIPVMKSQNDGSIIILSSTGGLRGFHGMSPYVTSKHAVMGLMKCAALEGAANNVRVNTVNPGPVNTRMMESIESGCETNVKGSVKDKFIETIPLKRYAEAEEVAELISFLSSEKASYLTGSSYAIDGGQMA